MNNVIGMSTGSLYVCCRSFDERISIFNEAGVDSIELLFGQSCELNAKLSDKSIETLHNYSFVSIHSPFKNDFGDSFNYCKDIQTRKVLDKIQTFYDDFSAKAVVVHPNQVSDWNVFFDYDFKVSVENMPKKHGVELKDLEQIMNYFQQFSLVLDTAHALTYSVSFLQDIVNCFADRISHVHLSDRRYSDYFESVKDHQLFSGCTDLSKFNVVKSLSCPNIIEIQIIDDENFKQTVFDEISFVKNYFKK
ncbi:MAG: hypothetical protein ABIC91_01020 [Nanoarchaeota archaeon]|nr:TIM barrel protein [Nanoarchaeota archaeon]MBU1850464.1 TIM barrel protein [Nanoarchaeota archaeon]